MNTQTLALVLLALLMGNFGSPALASSNPLFHKGQEKFKILNLKSETPVIRVFDDSMTKRSFAILVNSLFGFTKLTKEPQPYVDLRLEKLFLEPEKEKPERINIRMLISGKEFDLEPTLTRADLKSGKDISVRIPNKGHKLGLFGVSTEGHFKVRYNSPQNTLFINTAVAEINIENPLSTQETERVSFVGKAIRIIDR